MRSRSPGKFGWASGGLGTFQHLGGSLFELQAGVKFLGVRFKGGGPAMIDVIAGHNKVMFSSLVQTTPHIQAGKLRALGVGGKKRTPILPDVPTIEKPAYPATRRSTGGVSSRRPAYRRRWWTGCARRSRRCRPRSRCWNNSPGKAPRSSR